MPQTFLSCLTFDSAVMTDRAVQKHTYTHPEFLEYLPVHLQYESCDYLNSL